MRDEPYNNVSRPEKHNLHQHSKRSFDSSTNVSANRITQFFLNTWKKKKEDLASGKITKEEYFEWKINWPHTED